MATSVFAPVDLVTYYNLYLNKLIEKNAPIEIITQIKSEYDKYNKDIAWHAPEIFTFLQMNFKNRLKDIIINYEKIDTEWFIEAKTIYETYPLKLD
jgi:hypothetical protein